MQNLWQPQIVIQGFFTLEHWLRGQTLEEIADRLGFQRVRLSGGAAVYRLTNLPGVDDFEFAGYTHWSGGHPKTASPTTIDPAAVRRVTSTTRASWSLTGPSRLVKLVPMTPHSQGAEYPTGQGVHQWRITEESFRAGRVRGQLVNPWIAPGGRYLPQD